MPDFSSFSWKELVEVVEERVPMGRFLIPVVGFLLVAVTVVWSVSFLIDRAVRPFGAWVSARGGQIDQWSALVGVMLAGFLIFGAVVWFLHRRLKVWQLGLINALGSEVNAISAQIHELRSKAADSESANDAVRDIHRRLSAIEPPDMGEATDREGYRRAALIKALSSPTVASVAAAESAPRFSGLKP